MLTFCASPVPYAEKLGKPYAIRYSSKQTTAIRALGRWASVTVSVVASARATVPLFRVRYRHISTTLTLVHMLSQKCSRRPSNPGPEAGSAGVIESLHEGRHRRHDTRPSHETLELMQQLGQVLRPSNAVRGRSTQAVRSVRMATGMTHTDVYRARRWSF